MPHFERYRSLGHLSHVLARLFRKDIERRLRPLGLMPAHIPVIAALADGGALSQRDLGKWSDTEQPALAALLVRMEKLGLLDRLAHLHDGRVSLFKLTDLAKEKLPEFFEALDEGNRRAQGHLLEDERDRIIHTIHQMIRNLGGEPGLTPPAVSEPIGNSE